MHGKHMDEKRIAKKKKGIAKPFETEWLNGSTDEENFCTDAVKRGHMTKPSVHITEVSILQSNLLIETPVRQSQVSTSQRSLFYSRTS